MSSHGLLAKARPAATLCVPSAGRKEAAVRIDTAQVQGRNRRMACCNTGEELREEYENALKFEALSYARLIAHRRRHDANAGSASHVRHMHLVRDLAHKYTEGEIEAFD